MAYVKSNTISGLDINTFLEGARLVYGVGYGDYGYGQTAIAQPPVATGSVVTAAAWVNLRNMIAVSATHQGTAAPNLATANSLKVGEVITAHETEAPSADPYDLRITLNNITNNRLAANVGNLTLSGGVLTDSRSTAWASNITSSYATSFTSEDAARHFFNSGGQLRMRITQPASGNAQGEVWRSIFDNVLGTLSMVAHWCAISGSGTNMVVSKGYYDLTTSYQTIFNGVGLGGGAYANNELKIEAKVSGVAGLNGGNGDIVNYRVTMVDTHSGSGDNIPAGTAVVFDVLRATYLSGIATPAIVTVVNLNASNENPIWLTAPGSLGNTYVGESLTRQLVAVDPEGSQLTYSRNGELPPGLTLSPGGLISGTVTSIPSDATFAFDVLVSDGIGSPVSRPFSFWVNSNRAPVWVTAAGQIGDIQGGETVNLQLVATDADGDAITFSLLSSSLPAGLNLSPSGLISGTTALPYTDTTTTFTVRISDGDDYADRTFSYHIRSMPAQTLEFATNGNWTVPAGVNSVMFTWIIGGGGAGGTGNEVGDGGGGGGGGSGGAIHYQECSVTPGDVFQFTIGQGGTDFYWTDSDPDATPTVVYLNGTAILAAGPGGQGADNANTASPGGTGGTPNGLAGATAPKGYDDYTSSYGAAGAPGPLQGATGGAGGGILGGNQTSGNSVGKPGTGYGSGGGGGGCKDRTAPRQYPGGAGQPGYVQFIYPNKGATGGTPAR